MNYNDAIEEELKLSRERGYKRIEDDLKAMGIVLANFKTDNKARVYPAEFNHTQLTVIIANDQVYVYKKDSRIPKSVTSPSHLRYAPNGCKDSNAVMRKVRGLVLKKND